MVSGLVTSPCDQLRIFSGEATLILMESKSATAFPRSNGLERYKVSSCGIHDCRFGSLCVWPVVGDQCPVILPTLSARELRWVVDLQSKLFAVVASGGRLTTEH